MNVTLLGRQFQMNHRSAHANLARLSHLGQCGLLRRMLGKDGAIA